MVSARLLFVVLPAAAAQDAFASPVSITREKCDDSACSVNCQIDFHLPVDSCYCFEEGPGWWRINHGMYVTEELANNSTHIGTVEEGQVVNVSELGQHGGLIRGHITIPSGWITLSAFSHEFATRITQTDSVTLCSKWVWVPDETALYGGNVYLTDSERDVCTDQYSVNVTQSLGQSSCTSEGQYWKVDESDYPSEADGSCKDLVEYCEATLCDQPAWARKNCCATCAALELTEEPPLSV